MHAGAAGRGSGRHYGNESDLAATWTRGPWMTCLEHAHFRGADVLSSGGKRDKPETALRRLGRDTMHRTDCIVSNGAIPSTGRVAKQWYLSIISMVRRTCACARLTHPAMAHPIPAHDREHFAAVQQALAEDGLHVAMVSADRAKLNAYAGALARALAGTRGWHVEAYRASRLESIVVDLMLHRFDAALSRISGPPSGQIRIPAQAPGQPGCALFIPDAQAVPLQEFIQLARIASGTRQLRLIALFDDSRPFACEAHLRAMGADVAHWSLDDDAEATHNAEQRVAASGAGRARLSRLVRPLPVGAAGLAAAAALLLALLPAAPWGPTGSGHGTAVQETTLTRSGVVQLAGEPPADFGRRAADDDTMAGTGSAP